MPRSPRFGVLVLQTFPFRELVERWKTIEALGFDSLWVADHYVDPYVPSNLWFDGWTLLPVAAALTSRIQIGTMVSSIVLRHPAMLAKQAMTVDHVSGGRLILGIGAGRAPLDHAMLGLSYWEAPERTRRFREFVEIVRRMLTHQVTSYAGRHYQVKDAVMNPASVQQPHPRLMLAAHGESTLRLAARLADTWNTFVKFGAAPEEALQLARRQQEMLDAHCVAAGREPSAVSRSLLTGLTLDRFFVSREAFRDNVGRYRGAGFDEFIFYWTSEDAHPVFPNLRETTIPNRSTLEWVAEEVAALRAS